MPGLTSLEPCGSFKNMDTAAGEVAKKRRARPRGLIAEELLQAAEQVIIEKGFPALTVRAVAERSQVTWPMVMYYFDNKEGLEQKILDRQVEFFKKRVEPLVPQGEKITPVEWSQYLEGIYALLPDVELYYRIHVATISERGAFYKKMNSDVRLPMHLRAMANLILKTEGPLGRGEKLFASIEVEALCLQLYSLMIGYCDLLFTHSDLASSPEVVKASIQGQQETIETWVENRVLKRVGYSALSLRREESCPSSSGLQTLPGRHPEVQPFQDS